MNSILTFQTLKLAAFVAVGSWLMVSVFAGCRPMSSSSAWAGTPTALQVEEGETITTASGVAFDPTQHRVATFRMW